MDNHTIVPLCLRVNTYAEYLQSEHWKNLRDEFFLTYGDQCLICDTSIGVQAHHWRYQRSWYDCTIEDLIALCDRHHKKVHENGNDKLNKEQLVERYFRYHSQLSSSYRDPDWYIEDFKRRGMLPEEKKKGPAQTPPKRRGKKSRFDKFKPWGKK